MADAVERMAYVGATPWHRKGELVPEEYMFDIDYFEEQSGMNFSVHKEETYLKSGKLVPDQYAIVRDSDNTILGHCGCNWEALQNRDAFKWFQPYLESKELMLHTAGSLHNGSWVWVLAQLNRSNSIVVPGDEVAKFVLLANPHTGKDSIRIGFTKIRVVCQNTMNAAFSSKLSSLVKIRHGKNNIQNLEDVKTIMDMANAEFEVSNEQLKELTRRSFNTKTLHEYIKTVLMGKEHVNDEMSTRRFNQFNKILELVTDGRGQNNPKVRGTWYAAYQGVNEYLNYFAGRENNRLYSMFLDKSSEKDKEALNLALTLSA